MESINENRVRRRVTDIYDGMHAAQAESKSIATYVKGLMKRVGIHKEVMGSSRDFNKDIGSI